MSASESNRYGAGTTSGGEFLPKSAAWDTETIPSQRRGIRVFDEEFPQDGWTGGMLRALSGMVTFSSLITYDQYIYFQATCSDTAEIAIHQLYFPLWKLELDGTNQQILMVGNQLERNINFGIMKVACPEGSHVFKLTFDSGILRYLSGSVFIVFLVSPLFRPMRIFWKISLAISLLLSLLILLLKSQSHILGQNRLRSDVFTAISSEQLTTRTPIGVNKGFQPPYLEPRTLSLTYGSALRQDRRSWIYAHPRTVISLPHRVLPSEYLHGAVAMDPTVATQPVGDGVEFQVTIIGPNSNTDIVYNRVVNPRSNREDLHWHDFWIDLSSYLDSDIIIEFTTEYREDSQNDWAGWGVPEIVAWPNARENPGAVHPWYAPSASGIASPPNSWGRH